MQFTKMHGCGNDYIYIDGSREVVSDKPELARRLSDRHFGIGSDGVIFINPSEIADFEMEMYNADGSRGRMCGNGIRCVAKYVYDNGLARKNPLTIESCGDVKTLYLTIHNDRVEMVRVDMGKPVLKAEDIPADPSKTLDGAGRREGQNCTVAGCQPGETLDGAGRREDPNCAMAGCQPGETLDGAGPREDPNCAMAGCQPGETLDGAGRREDPNCAMAGCQPGETLDGAGPREDPNCAMAGCQPGETLDGGDCIGRLINVGYLVDGVREQMSAVSMGNPHAVIFVNDTDALDMERIGPSHEHHPAFPEGVNTEFVQVIDRTHIKMRVWERGSGETLACGTGSCASVVAAVLNGLTERNVTVHLLGGDLEIEWNEKDGHVYMTGPAQTVFQGEMDISPKCSRPFDEFS